MCVLNIFGSDSGVSSSSASAIPAISTVIAQERKKDQNTYIVVLRDSEEIISHRHLGCFYRRPIKSIGQHQQPQIFQQALISCPSNSEALNTIKQELSDNERIKKENQVRLKKIIRPVVQHIAALMEHDNYERPYAFIVDRKNDTVTPCANPDEYNKLHTIVDPETHISFNAPSVKVDAIKTDPISRRWFTDPAKLQLEVLQTAQAKLLAETKLARQQAKSIETEIRFAKEEARSRENKLMLRIKKLEKELNEAKRSKTRK